MDVLTNRWWVAATALLWATLWSAGLAAQDSPETPFDPVPAPPTEPAADPSTPGLAGPQGEQVAAEEVADNQLERYYEIRESTRRQIQSGQDAIHIYQLVEEMVDEVVADVSKLNHRVVSPAAVRSVGLTPNLSKSFGEFVEATLVSALANKSDVALKVCAACQSLRSRIEDGDWVVSLGLTRHEDLQREAARLGVKSFLDAKFSYFPGSNIVALNVRFISAEDGRIFWTETYRSDATTAAILRSGDRVVSRAEREKELERLLEARPYYGHILYVGGAHIPYDGPSGGITGASLGYRLYEKFGNDKRWMFGIGAEGFAKFGDQPLLGAFVGAQLAYEILPPNLKRPTYRAGLTAAGFFAGQEGNSFAVSTDFDVTLQFRLGAGVSLMYFLPVEFAGADLGGFGYKARASFNW